MADRVASNLGHKPDRRHAKQWDAAGTTFTKAGGSTNALGTLAPTGLGVGVAMGVGGSDGMLTVAIDGMLANAPSDLTFYTWNDVAGDWFALGANPGINTITYYERCQGSIQIPEGVPWFVKGSIVATDLYSDTRPHNTNPLA